TVTWPSDRSKRLGLRSALSIDGGRTFATSVSIGDETVVGERGFQSIAIDRDGVARAAWLDQRRDPGTPRHANAGEDWDPMHLMYAYEKADGHWSAEVRLASTVCGCCKTALATGADGSIYLAFRNIYPGNLRDISFTVSRDGRVFSSPVRVSEDHWALNGCPDDGPTMAIDRAGTVHIVWPTLVDGPEPAIGLFHASTRDGVTFTPRQRIPTLGTIKPSHPQMTLDGCGTLTLLWDEAQGAARRVAMRRLTPESSGAVSVGEATLISGPPSAVYPVVAPVDRGVVTAWNEIAIAGHPSAIGVRSLDFGPTCSAGR
ncbi:MAG TPA: hypothetical protein VLV86_09665, partial [Vicinamibacterales bacterium]|nr:hypothetical protein [Vicinamibacterales bacterium]